MTHQQPRPQKQTLQQLSQISKRLHGLSYENKSCLVQLRLWGDSWNKQSLRLRGSVVGALRPCDDFTRQMKSPRYGLANTCPEGQEENSFKKWINICAPFAFYEVLLPALSHWLLTQVRRGRKYWQCFIKAEGDRALTWFCKGPLASATATFLFFTKQMP